jgi:hypothetical protein
MSFEGCRHWCSKAAAADAPLFLIGHGRHPIAVNMHDQPAVSALNARRPEQAYVRQQR